jgi:hypothetical protein
MDIKTISISELQLDPLGTLDACAASGQPIIVELPDQRLIAIQSLEPGDEDSLTSDLLESHSGFQALVAKSKASPRRPFGQSE